MEHLSELFLVVIVASAVLLRPVARAWARRLDSDAQRGASADEIAQLQDRVAELEAITARMPELEERVDFAERLLAKGHDARIESPLQ